MDPVTRSRIKGCLEAFIESLIGDYRGIPLPQKCPPDWYIAQTSLTGHLRPFFAAIVPEELLRFNELEHELTLKLNSALIECARLIAMASHSVVQRDHVMKERVSLAAISEIDRQVALFELAARNGGRKPTLEQMIEAVLNARRDDDLELRQVKVDLHIVGAGGTSYFFEMKSPVPNKGQCLEVTQRILRIHLLRGQARPQTQGYFAMAYNPYGPKREDYRWTYALNYMPFHQAVLIGDEFWQLIGGPNAYEELLEVYQQVGREKSKYMLDALAFGF